MSKYFKSADGNVYESYNDAPYHDGDARVSVKEGKAAQIEQAKAHLCTVLKPGQTVYTILNHCSASGMSRSISVVVGGKDGEIEKLDYWIARAKGEHIDPKHGGIKMNGCGMDMGFSLVYNLGCMLWPTGTPEPHGMRNGQPDSSGGYALKQRWL